MRGLLLRTCGETGGSHATCGVCVQVLPQTDLINIDTLTSPPAHAQRRASCRGCRRAAPDWGSAVARLATVLIMCAACIVVDIVDEASGWLFEAALQVRWHHVARHKITA